MPKFPFELTGILARGSDRSRRQAHEYGVPLYTKPERLPADTDVACVVVPSGVGGGAGSQLAQSLMARGIHVLQEHPIHHQELAENLRFARRHRVQYQLNTFYPHLPAVRRFLAGADRLRARQRPLWIDAACSSQVAYALLDVLGQTLGGVRPWTLGDLAARVAVDALDDHAPAFRSLDGVVAGVPVTLRVQNQIHPHDPDNHTHLLHRITLGVEGGSLTLVTTHGPVVWSPRLHVPHNSAGDMVVDEDIAGHLALPTVTTLGPAHAPSFTDTLLRTWPAGVARALLALRSAVLADKDPLRAGQYQLAVARLWHDLTGRLGYPELIHAQAPHVLGADAVSATPTDSHVPTEV